MSDDKRRDPRLPSTQQVWCEGQGERARALNVSRTGMCITTEAPRDIGEQFKIKFDGDEGTIEVNMEVMWADEPATGEMAGMGLRIVGFDKGEDAYEKFVKRHEDAQQSAGSKPPSREVAKEAAKKTPA